jgi:drug/metabolite transporter (DMT)-like permease
VFNNLTNFSYQRSASEAVGFYIAYFIAIVFVAAIVGGVAGALNINAELSFQHGLVLGNILAAIACLGLALIIVVHKRLLTNVWCMLLVLLTAVLAFVGGALAGLIPVAYLTTRLRSGSGGQARPPGADPVSPSYPQGFVNPR